MKNYPRKIQVTTTILRGNMGNVTVKDFRIYEKLEYKKNKLKLDIDFLNSGKKLAVYLY